MRAKPTTHAGVNFRSRLEARWAEFFTRIGWRWQYEPDLGIQGYLPDFLILGDRPLLVEVGGVVTLGEYEVKAQKGCNANLPYDYLVVGALPELELPERQQRMADLWADGIRAAGLLLPRPRVGLVENLRVAVWFKCVQCSKVAIQGLLGSRSYAPCGHSTDQWASVAASYGDGVPREVILEALRPEPKAGPLSPWGGTEIQQVWNEVGNDRQWQPR